MPAANIATLRSPSPMRVERANVMPIRPSSTDIPESGVMSEVGARRTTRTRRPVVNPDAAVTTVSARPPPPARRKAPADRSGFPGLSSVALKSLTLTNTTRNQQNVVSLALEIIHKNGARPESPTVKVRKILQRAEEAKQAGRMARANRRARRSDEGPDTSSDLDGNLDEADSSVDGDDAVMMVEPARHTRGAGEEEDYKTPRQTKHLKLSDNADAEIASGSDRRVKWDRGLFEEVVLEDVFPRPRNSKEKLTRKGCLASSKVGFYPICLSCLLTSNLSLYHWTLLAISLMRTHHFLMLFLKKSLFRSSYTMTIQNLHR